MRVRRRRVHRHGQRVRRGPAFSLPSWEAAGGTGYPHEASMEEQIARAEIALEIGGWEGWPDCARRLGLR